MQKVKSIKVNDTNIPHFDYEEFGIKGVGKNQTPIVSMDKYIDHSLNKELHIECCKGLALNEASYKQGMIFGAITPEAEASIGVRSWTSILDTIERDHPEHLNVVEELISKDPKAVYRYIYFALNGAIPWFFGLYLKQNNFYEKVQGGQWSKAAKDFPMLVEYLHSLPFKHIGRVLFFTTFPGAPVIEHRDAEVVAHKDHNINLFFTKSRPSYVWDEIKKEKIYLEQNALSYFFNNRDYHGVDSEKSFRYTLRVDGTFTNEMCDTLGLQDGYTWHPDYER